MLAAQLDAWDKVLPPLNKDPYLQEGGRQPEGLGRARRILRLNNTPDYKLAYQHYFPGKL